MKPMTRQELARYDGKEGRPAYLAYQGKIYDVTNSKKWRGGKHMLRHEAGQDLTTVLAAAPHQDEVFANFEVVATLTTATAPEDELKAPWPLSVLYAKWPFFKRHAHPFAVHFPIGLLLAGFLFTLLHLVFGSSEYPHFDRTAFHLVVLAVCCAPFAVLTGMQSWWLFYGLGKSFKLMFKLTGGIVVVVLAGVVALLHVTNPDILTGSLNAMSYVYVALYAVVMLLVAAVGFVGGQLTFPE